jgi:hypothetical protein
VLEPPVIVKIVSWVGKVSVCCGDSWICGRGGGGGLGSVLTWGLALFGIEYMICGSVRGMLFVELVKIEDEWFWHSDMTGNKLEVGLGYFGRIVSEKAKGKMESIDGGEEPTTWYG